MKKEFLTVTISQVNRVKVRQLEDILKSTKELVTAFYNDEMYNSLAVGSQLYHDLLSADHRGDVDELRKLIQEQLTNFAWCQVVGDEPINDALYLVVDGENLITSFMGSEVEW